MIELSFGQKKDENGEIMPWFTHGCLDWIKQQDWSEKNIIMFGAGMGDIWLAKRCNKLVVVERNKEWIPQTLVNSIDIQVMNDIKLEYQYRPCNDSDGKADYYLGIPEDTEFDIIISDDAYRTEAVLQAMRYFTSKGKRGILICDNYNQSYVWRSPIVLDWLDGVKKIIFEQPDHEDYNKEDEPDGIWKTAVIFL
jgi:hypothetical protein